MGTFHPAALLRNPVQKKRRPCRFSALRDKPETLGFCIPNMRFL